ncbi:hypothetical protein BU26DRAFT_559376 [Trematosphaeria pertusa]|uniref:F-box domain-containing protein n=1 Tax=Trematosphaeria pertusa TaxID=390896 RepID=A0A6A6IZY2_9PLEO|nr:uncharacterized protein BU26DRAFT_559376 [Trematosphaeria pertusa]KAF2254713.1 hypothetical protein BU26DRAFT_559376 [Trematosphaeria pertusa]
MDKLPTELDVRIVSFLQGDRQALNAVSQVSEHYRSLAEPYLYENISLTTYQEYAIKCLLRTLIDRNELAQYIKNFDLTPETRAVRQPSKGPALYHDFWEYVNPIRDMIRSFKCLHPGAALEWFGRVFERKPYFDGAVALILCMATNLESINLNETRADHLRMTRELLLNAWWQNDDASDAYPFHKLKKLALHGAECDSAFVAPVLATITSLELSNCNQAQIRFFTQEAPRNPQLRTLIFKNAYNVNPIYFHSNFRGPYMPWLRNIKELVVQTPGGYTDDWDLPRLMEDFETYLPNLELLEWTRTAYIEAAESREFDTFKNLSKLKTLRVDHNLVFSSWYREFLEKVSNLSKVFPESLEHLELANLTSGAADEIVAKLHKTLELEASDNEGDEVTKALKLFHSQFPLKSLTLGLDMEYQDDGTDVYEMDPPTVVFLRHAADEMAKIGVVFKVYRMPGNFERFDKELVRAGYTAPLPHSKSTYDCDRC